MDGHQSQHAPAGRAPGVSSRTSSPRWRLTPPGAASLRAISSRASERLAPRPEIASERPVSLNPADGRHGRGPGRPRTTAGPRSRAGRPEAGAPAGEGRTPVSYTHLTLPTSD